MRVKSSEDGIVQTDRRFAFGFGRVSFTDRMTPDDTRVTKCNRRCSLEQNRALNICDCRKEFVVTFHTICYTSHFPPS